MHDDGGKSWKHFNLAEADPGIEIVEGAMTDPGQGGNASVLPALDDGVEKNAFHLEKQHRRPLPLPRGNPGHARMMIPDLHENEIDFQAQFPKGRIVHHQIVGQRAVKTLGENCGVSGDTRVRKCRMNVRGVIRGNRRGRDSSHGNHQYRHKRQVAHPSHMPGETTLLHGGIIVLHLIPLPPLAGKGALTGIGTIEAVQREAGHGTAFQSDLGVSSAGPAAMPGPATEANLARIFLDMASGIRQEERASRGNSVPSARSRMSFVRTRRRVAGPRRRPI